MNPLLQFVDVDVPGVVKIKSIPKYEIFTSGSYEVLYQTIIVPVPPAMITKQPNISFLAVINKGIGTTTTTRFKTVYPTIPDSAPVGIYVDAGGNTLPLTTFLSNMTTFGMKFVIGEVYFVVELLSGERFSLGEVIIS